MGMPVGNGQDLLQNWGNAIRERRKALNISVVAAAESAGISRVTWHRIENGTPSVSAGSYTSAMAVLNLTCVPRYKEDIPFPASDVVPLHIPFRQYPQLQFLAWHVHGTDTLTPREAWNIYQRNQRHMDERTLTENERSLLNNLRALFEETF